jgi:two-component system chemotaxis response regulator CheB
MAKTIKVLICDDSALMRQLLTEILSSDRELEVVGAAPDPYIARDLIKSLNPDVLTLDVEMPKMDGLTFLENLMRLRPMPVVMVSSLTEKGAEVTLQAMELGAIDFVTKPKIDLAAGMRSYTADLISKVKTAARAHVRAPAFPKAPPKAVLASIGNRYRTTERLIAIGASTGGTEAIKEVLERMPADAPAIVITQHIPALFSGPFAARMDRSSAMKVCEATSGQQIVPGHVYIAPGDRHLEITRSGARFVTLLTDAPPENRHRPSVDVLFKSVARFAGVNAVGCILTGMGDDGARGLLEMKKTGAHTIVQDEATSVVWGMPGAAFKMGATDRQVKLENVAAELLNLCAADKRAA